MQHGELWVLFHLIEIRGLRERHHVALARLELGVARGRVAGDRVDQVVDLGATLPVAVERLVPDHRVLLVGPELERAGADRINVGGVGRALLLHRLEIFLRQDRRKIHRHVGKERCLGPLEVETHRRIVDLLNGVDDVLHAHVVVIGEGLAGGHLVKRMIVVGHTVPREKHVIGVEVAARREIGVAVKLDALAQLEGVGLAVGRHRPRLRECGDDVGGAELELDQPVEHRHRHCIESGSRGEELWLEALGAAFRAKHEGALRHRAERQQQGKRKSERDGRQARTCDR